jgi:hypothetical protein
VGFIPRIESSLNLKKYIGVIHYANKILHQWSFPRHRKICDKIQHPIRVKAQHTGSEENLLGWSGQVLKPPTAGCAPAVGRGAPAPLPLLGLGFSAEERQELASRREEEQNRLCLRKLDHTFGNPCASSQKYPKPSKRVYWAKEHKISLRKSTVFHVLLLKSKT